jgi:nitrite reductase (NO-forming)
LILWSLSPEFSQHQAFVRCVWALQWLAQPATGRFYIVDAGPTVPCAFHIVGAQFDTVYLGAPPANAIHGVQTFNVPAGGGMIFEPVANVSGEFPFVNHQFAHGQKGAIGVLVVEE